MGIIYNNILKAIANRKKLLAVLIDPDKMQVDYLEKAINVLNKSMVTHIFVGGSDVKETLTEAIVLEIKKHSKLPVLLFPGDVTQITNKADALLFLSLISGRNPDYLIGKHVEAVSKLKNSDLEVIPTGYILIENGRETSVQKVTQTIPLKREPIQHIVDTAKAGEILGMKLIYLEAGSGATYPITPEIISAVKDDINMPLIVGGGIRTKQQLEQAYGAGADLVVIGTAFEEDQQFFNNLA